SGLASLLPGRIDRCLSSPARRAVATAEAAGFTPGADPDLAEGDFGSWTGLTLEEVRRLDPEGLALWLKDPEAAPHGGESLATMAARLSRFLGRSSSLPGATLAVTHAGPIRACVALALEAPLQSFWRVDIAPLSVTELRAAERGWGVVRVNCRRPHGK
ncbi:MAG: histidine phosphatase family protein, partial [bacterium]